MNRLTLRTPLWISLAWLVTATHPVQAATPTPAVVDTMLQLRTTLRLTAPGRQTYALRMARGSIEGDDAGAARAQAHVDAALEALAAGDPAGAFEELDRAAHEMVTEVTTPSACVERVRDLAASWRRTPDLAQLRGRIAWEWAMASARLQGLGEAPARDHQRFLGWYRDQLTQVVGQLPTNPMQAEDVLRSIPAMARTVTD